MITIDKEADADLTGDAKLIADTLTDHLELARLNRLLFAIEADKKETMAHYTERIKEVKTLIKAQLNHIDDSRDQHRLPFDANADDGNHGPVAI